MNNKLKEIAKELNTQDNRGTSDPIFLVQQKNRTYGMEEDYAEGYVWLNEDGDEAEIDLSEDLDKEDGWSDWIKVYFKDDWQFVTCCFTEKAANQYIKENMHNLIEPRIYVATGYNNSEWTLIHNYLKDL